MSGYLGSFIIDDTCTFYANAHTPSTGAAVDADAVPGYRVYEDETATPILTGSMALLDDANTVGFYSEQIILSAINGFEAGKSYCIRITIVVATVTGTQLQTLQIGARVDTRLLGGTAQTGRDIGASVLLSSGSGAGQLDFTSGVVKSNLSQILGTALTETAGLLAGGFKKLFNVAAPTGTLNSIPDAVAGAAGGLFIAGTNAATTVTTSLTTTFTGNLSGSVGSLGVTAKTDVNAEVVDALNVDTYAEPGQATPAATTTLVGKIGYLYKAWRNKSTQTATTYQLFNDDALTVDQKAIVSDDGTTFTKGEVATGP